MAFFKLTTNQKSNNISIVICGCVGGGGQSWWEKFEFFCSKLEIVFIGFK